MAERQKALSVPNSSSFGCFGMAFGFVFSSMFFGLGSFFLWMIALQPIMNLWASNSWVETPCVITKSDVKGNDTYRVEIEYDYTFNGQRYHGDRYDFFEMSTGGRTAKERIVAKYKVGSTKKCFVAPNDPTQSVLSREVSAKLWWGLFPIPFILVGLVGYWAVFFGRGHIKKKADKLLQTRMDSTGLGSTLSTSLPSQAGQTMTASRVANQSEWSNSSYDEEDLFEEPGAITLAPNSSPFTTAIFLFVFALIWNGVISVFLISRWDELKKFNFDFEDFFLIPFVLVGIGVVLAAIHQVMAAFNPKPILLLSRQLIPLGGSARLEWRFPSGVGSIRKLKITLVGSEEARYRRGTNTYTDTHEFHEEVLLETSDPLEFGSGEVEVPVAGDLMHSFNGGNNKVIWQLRFQGDIPLWPDVNEKFPIRVVPHE